MSVVDRGVDADSGARYIMHEARHASMMMMMVVLMGVVPFARPDDLKVEGRLEGVRKCMVTVVFVSFVVVGTPYDTRCY